MQKAHPDRNIAIIKYSLGGTSIDPEASAAERFGCWDTEWSGGEGAGKGINQFDHFLATLKNARADKDIDDDGEPDKLIPAGILWMQGESDAMEPVVAEEYQENLADLMEEIREAFGDTKIAIGRITDWEVWTHGEVVRKAQADFVAEDGNAALVTSTDEYGKSDKWHYDTAGYIDLGEKFAGAFEEKE
jgi:iduronate 2-sulfatase